MEQYQLVFETLQKLNIPFELVEHPPVFTTEEADRYIVGEEVIRTKTLFLCNQKKTAYYLIIMDDTKRLDMEQFAEILHEKRLSFCSPKRLQKKMALYPGAVSIFGLLNNNDHDINVYLDKAMLSEKFISFHPNVNTKTILIATEDMYKFITSLGYEYTIVEL